MRIMTTTKVPVYVSLAVAGVMALSACGSNSSNDASNSSPSSSSSTASKAASAGGSGTVSNGGGNSANSGSGANGGAANSGAEGGTGTDQNSGTGAQSGSVTGADTNGGAQANQGAEAQGGAQQQADPGGANAANDEHNVTKNPNALTPGEYVIHREASWDYVDTTGSRYHVDGDGGWTSVGEDGTSTVAAGGSWTKNYADGHTVARVEADGTYRVTYDGQLSPEMPSNAVPVSPGKLPDPKAVPAVNPVQPTKPGM